MYIYIKQQLLLIYVCKRDDFINYCQFINKWLFLNNLIEFMSTC